MRLLLVIIFLGVCYASTIPRPAPHPVPHPAPKAPKPAQQYYSRNTWLIAYIIISSNQHHHIEEHGQFNNITFISNCSQPIHISLDISGYVENITILPNSYRSIYINDSDCQGYAGFKIIKSNIYSDCELRLDYSFTPCEDRTFLVLIIFIFIIVILGVLLTIAVISIAIIIYRKIRQHKNYTEPLMPLKKPRSEDDIVNDLSLFPLGKEPQPLSTSLNQVHSVSVLPDPHQKHEVDIDSFLAKYGKPHSPPANIFELEEDEEERFNKLKREKQGKMLSIEN